MQNDFVKMDHLEMAKLMYDGAVLETEDGSLFFHDEDGYQIKGFKGLGPSMLLASIINIDWNALVRIKKRTFDIKEGEWILGRNRDDHDWKLDVFRGMRTPDRWDEYPFPCDVSGWEQIARYVGNEKYHRTKDKIQGRWTKEDL